jgi:hypothetical protein
MNNNQLSNSIFVFVGAGQGDTELETLNVAIQNAITVHKIYEVGRCGNLNEKSAQRRSFCNGTSLN